MISKQKVRKFARIRTQKEKKEKRKKENSSIVEQIASLSLGRIELNVYS